MTHSKSNVTHLRLPDFIAYPVVVTDIHIKQGSVVIKGDPLYTLQDAKNVKGIMRAPFAARIAGPTVSAGTSFTDPTPVISLIKLEAQEKSHQNPVADNPPPTEHVKPVASQPEADQTETQAAQPKKKEKKPGFVRQHASKLAFTLALVIGIPFLIYTKPFEVDEGLVQSAAYGSDYLYTQIPTFGALVRRYEVDRADIFKERQRRYKALIQSKKLPEEVLSPQAPSDLEQKAFELWLY